jgi:hypothetical protein
MRYISKEALYRAHYRTLPEWVKLIQQASDCSAKSAQQQILDGLYDGAFAVRWDDRDKNPLRYPNPYLTGIDSPPPKGVFWRRAKINWRTGKVIDDWGLEKEGQSANTPCRRALLLASKGGTVFEHILHSSVSASTHQASAAPNNVVPPHSEPTAAEAHPVPRGRPGRKPGSGSIDDEEALRKMVKLLAAGEARSVLAASERVAGEGKPIQSHAANMGRLRRKFAKRWGTDPPEGKTWAEFDQELNTN